MDQEEHKLKSNGYVKVAKALDKRSLYLWYSRAQNKPAIQNIATVRIDDKEAHLRVRALEASGYQLYPTFIDAPKPIFSLFGGSKIQPRVGIYILRANVV